MAPQLEWQQLIGNLRFKSDLVQLPGYAIWQHRLPLRHARTIAELNPVLGPRLANRVMNRD